MTISTRTIKVIADYANLEPDAVLQGFSLTDDLGFDSLDKLELVMMLEEEFECQIPDELAEIIQTVQDVIDHIGKINQEEVV